MQMSPEISVPSDPQAHTFDSQRARRARGNRSPGAPQKVRRIQVRIVHHGKSPPVEFDAIAEYEHADAVPSTAREIHHQATLHRQCSEW